MTLPGNVGYGTVTGQLLGAAADTTFDIDLDPDSELIQGSVTFTPSVDRLVNATSVPPVVILPKPITVTLDEDGAFSVVLVATDDADLSPVGWTYLVTFDLELTALAAFNMAVPEGVTTNIASVIPIAASPGGPSTQTLAVTTSGRPAATAVGVGATVFDTTIGKPIWSNGTVWVLATGVPA